MHLLSLKMFARRNMRHPRLDDLDLLQPAQDTPTYAFARLTGVRREPEEDKNVVHQGVNIRPFP